MAMTWTDHMYGSGCTGRVGKFAANVSYSIDRTKPGYIASFGESRLKKHFDSRDEAMRAAEALARRLLTEALAELDEPAASETGSGGR